MHCPLDQAPLKLHAVGTYVAHRCEHCSGIFLSGDVFREIRASAAFEAHRRKAGGMQIATQGPSRINCLNDASAMMLFSFKGVEIDFCTTCFSVWLDRGELEKLSEHLRQSQKLDLSKVGAHLGALEPSGNRQSMDTSDVVDLIELILDICSYFPNV